jgi:ribulose-phosphate 3-epimerase
MASRFVREELITRLRAASPGILPSLLACDFAHLEREIHQVEVSEVPALHLDVMDGHFVPNLSIGVPIVEAVRRVTDLPLDVHLMISDPAKYIEPFRKAGADSLTIHVEAVADPRPLLDQIRSLGALAGLALNPPTPLSAIEPSLKHCDLILVMSVMPGFGGQKFDEVALNKLCELRERSDCDALLEVDGGIGLETIGPCAEAGAELLVAGTAIFRTDDYAGTISRLRSSAQSSVAGLSEAGRAQSEH